MKRKLITLLAALTLTLVAGAINAPAADAHIYDSSSLVVCTATRPFGASNVHHAVPTAIYGRWVIVYCYAQNDEFNDFKYQWYVAWNVDTLQWVLIGDVQNCAVVACQEP